MTATIPTSLPCDADPADVTEPAWHGGLYAALSLDGRAEITADLLHTDDGVPYLSLWIHAPGGGQLHLSLSAGAQGKLATAIAAAKDRAVE